MQNVFNILSNAASKWPNHIAIYDSKGHMTFKDLWEESSKLAEELKSQGVIKGTGLGVQAVNSREFIIGLFAGVGSGATVMPLSHQLRQHEIDEIIKESGLHFIMDDYSQNKVEDKQARSVGNQYRFRISTTSTPSSQVIAPHVNNPAFIRFTSGTTGKSKGVVVSHESIYQRVQSANKALELGEKDVVIWVLPIAYHFMASIVLYVYHGAAIALADNFMAPTVLNCIQKYQGTLLYASPMHLRMLASDKSGTMIPSLNKVISTSTAISKEICSDFYNRYQKPVRQAYGIIEIGLPLINNEGPLAHPDSVGKAVEGFRIGILDENGNELPNNVEGVLGISGPGMFDAYLNPPMMREEALTNGYFLTADLAVKNDDGFVFVKGRNSAVINVSGNKVFPEEVEALLNMLPGVSKSRIYGAPHAIMGQIVQADVVASVGHIIDEEELISYCRKNLSTFKIPQKVKVVDEIAMTGSGKIKRH